MTAAAQRGRRPSPDGPSDVATPASLPATAEPDAPDPFAHARAVADAVLYEGYLLYPYRRSSEKNRVRWQFGVLAPRAVIEAAGPPDTGIAGSADAWYQQTECLLEAPDDARLHVRLRFLQVQRRAIEVRAPDGRFLPADALDVDGQRLLTFEEAVAREFDVTGGVGELTAGRTVHVSADGGDEIEELCEREHLVGRIVRRTEPVSATVRLTVSRTAAPFRLHRVRLVVENADTAVPADAPRPEALRFSLVAAHSLIGVDRGGFLSLLDPPEWAAGAAAACANVHTFPVLAGAGGGRDVVLSSPIILYDHPRIAPESPGPLFDSGEIDEILSLRALTLTEEEKREARATDPRAAAILDRVDSLPDEIWTRLHGAIRSLRPVEPEPDSVLVAGTRITAGSRVRLHPRRRGTDAQDVFLAGRTATVDRVLLDVDGSRFVAVIVDDDPGGELLAWYGRSYHFTPDEIEALP